MELLILALIIGAVNAFFSNKKKNEQETPPARKAGNQQTNPNQNPARGQGGFKRMEDYAKEIYGEFQAQMNAETEKRPQATEAAKEAAKEAVGKYTASRPDRQPAAPAVERQSGRLSAHQKQARPVREKTPPAKNLFPLTQSEAQKGIILAEIFMPPKAKRK